MYYLHCVSCGRRFGRDRMHYTCPDCGGLNGTLEVRYDYVKLRKQLTRDSFEATGENSILRYRALLPLGKQHPSPPLRLGMTPLYNSGKLAVQLGIGQVFLKDDSQNPSLSLKDRATLISLLKAKEFGYEVVSTASTGNAAASLACWSAALGFRNVIFVPKTIPEAKLVQLMVYDARIVLVDGNYDLAFDLCLDVCRENNWYNRSTAINPYNVEGKKTVSFEICEQLEWNLPEYIFVPVGDGCIISSVWKGFTDLYQAGLIDKLPKLVACQAEGSASIARSFRQGLHKPLQIQSKTIADSISVDLPRDGVKAIIALRESEGDAVTVTDEEIMAALHELASLTGIFVEPSSAVTWAAARKFFSTNVHGNDTDALLLLTGSGLKDLASARAAVKGGITTNISPDDDNLAARLAGFMLNKEENENGL
jgi:threonine synthase